MKPPPKAVRPIFVSGSTLGTSSHKAIGIVFEEVFDLLGRYYAEAYDMTVMTTRMFTHTGPRRGDVFAESSDPTVRVAETEHPTIPIVSTKQFVSTIAG